MTNNIQARHLIDDVAVFCVYDEIIEIEKLKGNPKNPNSHSKEQIELLAEVIKKTGWRAPITVSNLSGLIVKGHGRLEAAKLAGFKKAPVEYQNFKDEEEEMAALLADNKIAELAEIDDEKLREIFNEFDFDDLSLTGYSQDEFEEFKDIFEEVELMGDPDEVPEEIETKCKPGDIWQLGEHRLMCGDSTIISDVEKLMNGAKASMLITDPPYNVDYEGGTGLKIQNDNMEDAKFRQFLYDAFTNANIVLKEGGVFYIWHADSEGYNFRGACNDVGWKVRQCLIWNKNTIVLGRQDYHWKHEPCLYGWKDGASHLWASDRKQSTVIDFDKPTRNGEHPTMKPVGLFDYQIRNNTKSGDLVLDLFGGSGTTLIACEQNKRVAYLMELDPYYCDVIITRWETLTGKSAKLCENSQNDREHELNT